MCSLFPCLLNAVLQADGNSALLIAAAEGHTDVVMALINHHAAVNQEDVRAAYTVWTHACACSTASEYTPRLPIKSLAHCRCHVHACVSGLQDDNITPLYIASAEGHAEVVTELLDHGALVNQVAVRSPDDSGGSGVAAC